MKKLEYRELKYKKILIEKISRISNVTLTSVCKRLDIRPSNVKKENGLSTEKLELLLEEYINSILKEIILAQSDIAYEQKIYYGGRKKDVKHQTGSL